MASGETAGRLFRPAFAALCETHGVKLAVLFGSLVTGRASRSSDIDLRAPGHEEHGRSRRGPTGGIPASRKPHALCRYIRH